HAAAWAEWRFGAGRGSEDLFVLFIGTGVGGCSISRGRLLLGASGSGGEVGHLTLVSGGHPCRCRHRGCIEAYLSGWAIERDALAAVSEPADDPSSDAGASPDDQWLRAVLAR